MQGETAGYLGLPKDKSEWPAALVVRENRGLNPYIDDTRSRGMLPCARPYLLCQVTWVDAALAASVGLRQFAAAERPDFTVAHDLQHISGQREPTASNSPTFSSVLQFLPGFALEGHLF